MSGIKLEVGKRYVDCDGKEDRIAEKNRALGLYIGDSGRHYFEDGAFYSPLIPCPEHDLIALAPDEAQQPDELATLRARVKELERETIDAALRAWPETNDVGAEPGLLIDELAGEREALRAENARLREALERISELTPGGANARDARDMHLTVKAIADTALARTEEGR